MARCRASSASRAIWARRTGTNRSTKSCDLRWRISTPITRRTSACRRWWRSPGFPCPSCGARSAGIPAHAAASVGQAASADGDASAARKQEPYRNRPRLRLQRPKRVRAAIQASGGHDAARISCVGECAAVFSRNSVEGGAISTCMRKTCVEPENSLELPAEVSELGLAMDRRPPDLQHCVVS